MQQQVKDLTDKLANIDTSWNQRTADMQKKVAGSDGAINTLKQENQNLKNALIVAQKKSMPLMFSWMTSNVRLSCNGLCMAVV